MTGHTRDGRRTGWNAEDRACPADVCVDGRLGDAEEQSDLLRLEAAGYGAQHLTLTIGQRGDRLAAPCHDTARNEIAG